MDADIHKTSLALETYTSNTAPSLTRDAAHCLDTPATLATLAKRIMEESQSWPGSQDDRSEKTAERLRALREQANEKLGQNRRRFSDIEADLSDRIELIAKELANDRAESTGQQEEVQQQLQSELHQCQEALADSQAEAKSLREQLGERDAQLAEQAIDLEESLQQVDEFQQECQSLREETSEVDKGLKQAQEDSAQSAQRLSDLQTEHTSAQQDLESAHKKNRQAATLLGDAEKRILQLSDTSEFDAQLEESHRKTELALADVYELKRENAELREELVRRPEADQQESSELVSLRSERDALATRIADLENAPTPEVDTDATEQLADLQHRFELAVEDVRHLKQENEVLANKLATGQKSVAIELPDGQLDWEAQKERLLQQLAAEEGEPIEEPRHEERATIEGTITITDRIVAEKDEEIAQLKSQEVQEKLSGSPVDLEEVKRSLREELLGDEAAVREECERLQQLQGELQEKMRDAELEFSVERAKLAREKSTLDEKLSHLPSKDAADAPGEGGKPGRRWLSALGLRDEKSE